VILINEVMRKMAKIKENMDNSIEGKLKRFEEIMGYSISDKRSWIIRKLQAHQRNPLLST
jgi:hypothetical protein